jgi:hypothetical protein
MPLSSPLGYTNKLIPSLTKLNKLLLQYQINTQNCFIPFQAKLV